MIYTVCIKTNNTEILDYLLENGKKINIEGLYISKNTFKIYNNIMFHYLGQKPSYFYSSLSEMLTNCIIAFYESALVRKIILSNYFYFSDSEKKAIYKNCILDLATSDSFCAKFELIFHALMNYFPGNKQMVLDGFVHFRMKPYINLLDTAVDLSVDKFLVEREYVEFVNLLKLYIDSKPSSLSLVHLIYFQEEAILLDENKSILETSSMLNPKYLSDISFSTNDYALNTLLTLLPKQIKIHLNCDKDEFIHTLELIFGSRITFCYHCSFCEEICKAKKLTN